MPRLSYYVLRQLAGPIALFTFLLTSVIWLSQSLRLLDLVINRGQSAPTFVYLTLLILPGLLVIILPLSYFAGTLFGLNKGQAHEQPGSEGLIFRGDVARFPACPSWWSRPTRSARQPARRS